MQYQVDTQEQTFWCWAAVAQSVRAYFAPRSPLSQCEVATETLRRFENPRLNCCRDPVPCDIPYYLDRALTQVGHLNFVYPAPLSWNDVRYVTRQMNRPLCAYLASASSGHYVVITDAFLANGAEYLLVHDPDDPFRGAVQIAYDQFRLNYAMSGYLWRGCFLVQP